MTKALVAQWIERLPSKQVVASSILAVGLSITYFLHFIINTSSTKQAS